jgi:hypothetical protein
MNRIGMTDARQLGRSRVRSAEPGRRIGGPIELARDASRCPCGGRDHRGWSMANGGGTGPGSGWRPLHDGAGTTVIADASLSACGVGGAGPQGRSERVSPLVVSSSDKLEGSNGEQEPKQDRFPCDSVAFGCVRSPRQHSIDSERSYPQKSGRGLPHSKPWRKHDAPRSARSVLECGAPAPLSAAFEPPGSTRSIPNVR